MAEAIEEIGSLFLEGYSSLNSYLGKGSGLVVQVFLFAALLVVVSVFIWEFYKSISKKDLISLNLKRYNRFEHPVVSKLFAMFLYFVEYILIMPLLIAFWFVGLAVMLLLIAEERSIQGILLICAVFVSAIRILAYHRAEISKDLAKLFPFITLSVFILTPGSFQVTSMLDKVYEIPDLLWHILYYLVAIFVIEVVLRVLYLIFDFFRSEEERIGG